MRAPLEITARLTRSVQPLLDDDTTCCEPHCVGIYDFGLSGNVTMTVIASSAVRVTCW